MRVAAAAISLACIVLILLEVFEVMLLPRRVRRRLRLVGIFFRLSWRVWSAVSCWRTFRRSRETMLSFYGPFSMLVLFALWIGALISAFGLLQWSAQPDTTPGRALYLSGSTFFTLGYGDVTPSTHISKVLAVFESGAGFGFVAVVIGYIPVLYQLFSRRETHVIQLDARAGSPPSAVTLLTRHAEGQGMESLYQLMASWESWASEMVESHLSYPMLSYYRSQHDNQNWLAAMCAIMDSSALILVGLREVRTFPARMAFSTSRLALVELSRVFRVQPRPDAGAKRSVDFEAMAIELERAGLYFTEDEPEERLAAFRDTYEPFLVGLSEYLLLPLPDWLPSATLDNWQNSPRGRRAKQLVESAPAKGE